ncbi:hypothetical protein FOL47_002182 [Perkinsus chesapeaki]|uniref:HeH/LEM domain-containing protein n=1 Tax=Perkinsus chesapeaki TaxID=330153 RepID=A0A7J6MG40_PERCH|nr:hypothetical protein FOL47_002182 [Perkinsus chesapeaki]
MSPPSTYASLTIAELRSLLTRNGVQVPQSNVKKAVLVNLCLKELGPEGSRRESSAMASPPPPLTPPSSRSTSPVAARKSSAVSRDDARGGSTRVTHGGSSRRSGLNLRSFGNLIGGGHGNVGDAYETFGIPTGRGESRRSAALRKSSRARTSLASAVSSEGPDLVDVGRVFSSDDEDLSEMSESPEPSRYNRGRSSMGSLPKASPSTGEKSTARRRKSSRPPSRTSAVSQASVEKTLFASPEDEVGKSRRVTISPLSYLRPLKEDQKRRTYSIKMNTLFGIALVVVSVAAYWYLPGPRLRYCDGQHGQHLNEKCEPCPAHATCHGFTMACDDLFKREGDVCVRDEHLYMVSHHMAASLADYLAERKGDHECYMTRYQLDESEAKRYLRERCWEARRLSKTDFDISFKLMLSESLPNEYGAQIVHTAGGTLWSLKSTKRLHCRITEAVQLWWKPVCLVAVVILFLLWRIRRWSNRRWARKSALQAVAACTRIGSDGSIRGLRVHDLATEVLGWPEAKVRAYMDELSKHEADLQSSGDGEYWSEAAVKRLAPQATQPQGYRMF